MCKLKFINVHLTKASSISVALPIQRLKSRSFHHMKNGDPQQRVAFSENLLNRGDNFLAKYLHTMQGYGDPNALRSFSNIMNETHQSLMCSAPCP